jgi:hypothetical protein
VHISCRSPAAATTTAPAPPPAGLPGNNSLRFCAGDGSSCYYLNNSALTYQNQRAGCQAMGGYLFGPNSIEEQRAVENFFVRQARTWTSSQAAMSIGVELVASTWWVACG